MDERCPECGGRFDRPGLYLCDDPAHPEPTLAQRIVLAIERALDDRRGLSWTGLDDEVADELRDRLAEIVAVELNAQETP